LIVAEAERLFAKSGLEGVSFRQIGAAAGAANHYAVQYHFGDKAGLVRAIFASHLPALEAKRAAMLTAITQAGRLSDPRALVEVIFRPIAEEKDHEGKRNYAAFLRGLRHFDGLAALRRQSDDLAPLTQHVIAILSSALPHIPSPWFEQRMLNATAAFIGAIVEWDEQRAAGGTSPLSEEAFISDAIDSATAALAAPLSPAVLLELERFERSQGAGDNG
jgi:AcrR family transcriptional regulator